VTLRKNVASQKLVFTLINATTGAALTGATVTAKISLDGGSSTTATGAVTELANGQYLWSPDQADTNCNVLGVQFTATNAIPRSFTIYTAGGSVGNPVPVDTTHFGGTAGTFASGRPEVNLNGDLTATMKTSVTTAATAATPTVTAGTVSDKTGYALSSGGVQAIWDAATSALTTVGSIGKWILDKLDVVVSTRLASVSYTAPPSAASNASAVRTELGTELARVDATVSSRASQTSADADHDLTQGKFPANFAALGIDPAGALLNVDIVNAVQVVRRYYDSVVDDDVYFPAGFQDLLTALELKASQSSVDALPEAIGGGELEAASGENPALTRDLALRLAAATSAGKFTGPAPGAAGTGTLRDVSDSTDLVVSPVDANGNRTAPVVTP